jgi:protoporphyrinogen oxidase
MHPTLMEEIRVGIIGAGPAGLTAAYLLSKENIRPIVWESDATYVGGISRTVVYKGYRFDIGGHRFFSKSKEVEDLWSELLPDDLLTCSRLSRIYYRGKFYSYPLEIGEVINNLGKRESLLTVASYLKAKLLSNTEPDNLEEWVTRKFGGRLYRMFFKSYTEKVWGMPCREISADWAAQRIKGLSLSKAARNAMWPQPSPTEIGNNRTAQIKTLITSFRYPRLGPGMLWEAAAEKVTANGGSVRMDTRVTAVEHTPAGTWRVTARQGNQNSRHEVDHLISSAPLGWLIQTIQPQLPDEVREAARGLRYRDFLTVALIVRPRVSFGDNWIYIHDPDLKVGRIQNFGNWSAAMVPEPGMACYGLEYFTSEDESLWKMQDAELIALANRELEALQLVHPGDVLDAAVVRQPKAYPVYDDDYSHRRQIIRKALETHCPRLHVVGRNGMHQYNNQDHSMMTGILTAKNIIDPDSKRDPWLVNQDAEYIEGEESVSRQEK